MTSNPYKYILITSCKNEGKNLPHLIDSIASQTVRPILWVITDDGSTDNTPKLIREAKERHHWIQTIRLAENKRDIGLHLSEIIKKGFNFAIEYCIKTEIKYDYLGNIDGDMIIQNTFFEELIAKFDKNSKLGIASGGVQYNKGNHVIHANVRVDEPGGGNMLIRRECFEDTKGILLSYSWDSALKVKARLHGWETMCFEKIKATETRDATSAEGYWKGYVEHGKTSYYMNTNPIHAMIKGIMYLFKRPYYIGLAYLCGYSCNLILRKEQINDEEIKHYYRYMRPQEIRRYYFDMLKTKFKKIARLRCIFQSLSNIHL